MKQLWESTLVYYPCLANDVFRGLKRKWKHMFSSMKCKNDVEMIRLTSFASVCSGVYHRQRKASEADDADDDENRILFIVFISFFLSFSFVRGNQIRLVEIVSQRAIRWKMRKISGKNLFARIFFGESIEPEKSSVLFRMFGEVAVTSVSKRRWDERKIPSGRRRFSLSIHLLTDEGRSARE